jgi:hypothetical protein
MGLMESEVRSVAIKIGIAAVVLITIGISLRNPSTLGASTGKFGVFMVQPTTSIQRFEELGHACGGPNHSWVTGYTTYNGKRLSLSGATYSSQSEAIQMLRNSVQGAKTIQETGNRYNQEGQIVGERVVALVAVEDKGLALIVWTQGESVFEIESESLECAMEFERMRIDPVSSRPKR